MKKSLKIYLSILLLVACGVLSIAMYNKYILHKFITISDGKVYNSGRIPVAELPSFLQKYNIKSVVDLRDGTEFTALTPENISDVNLEAKAINGISNVNYFHLPTPQIPADSTVLKFLEIMKNPENYPVLIHCHHGTGRSRLFSAIYRIEFENWSNEKAQKNARLIYEFAYNFEPNTEKGTYLLNYEKSSEWSEITNLHQSN